MDERVRVIPAGRITLALTLIAIGVVVLIQNVAAINLSYYFRIFWPAVMVAFGLEIIWRQHQADSSSGTIRVRIDGAAVILLFLIVLVMAFGNFPFFTRRPPFWGRWPGW